MQILPWWGARAPRASRVGAWLLPMLALALSCGTSSKEPGAGTQDGGTDSSGGGSTDAPPDVSEDGASADGNSSDTPEDLPPGACAAPVRVTQPPVTGSGPASLGMADSDGNGLRDIDEWGPTKYMALDSDYDGEPDYQDYDDDGDGILDIYDKARLEALTPGISPDTHVSFTTFTGPTDISVSTAVRQGDRVTLTATGIGCATMILLEGPGLAPLNFSPSGIASGDASGSQASFLWPAGAYRSVSLVIDGKRSDSMTFDVRPAMAPLLALAGKQAKLGSPFTLSGMGVNNVTAVAIDGTDVAPTSVAGDSVTFTLPAGTRRGLVSVKSPGGTSNQVSLKIVHPVGVTFSAPAGVDGTFETASGATVVPLPSGVSTPVDVDALGPGTVTVLRTRGDGALVVGGLAWLVPEDTTATIDMKSTAFSLALGRVDPLRQLVPASWAPFRTIALALPEVAKLAATLTTLAPMSDAKSGGLGLDTSGAIADVDAASTAVQTALETGLAAGTLTAPMRQKKAHADGDPIIDPPSRNDVTPSGYGDQGNLKVENDTSLYLSASIRENDTKRLLLLHATTAYSPKFISPQDGLGVSPAGVEVFGASEVEFKAPSFRNSKLRVVTPGQISPHPTDPIEVAAARALFLTTVIDRVIAPVMKEIVGHRVEGKLLGEILVTHAYPQVVEAYQAMTEKGFAAGAATLLNFFQREFKEQGPFFSALTDTLLRTFLEGPGSARLKGLAVQGALKVAPVIDALNKAATGVTVLKTIFDIVTTPATLEFDVAFKMSAIDVLPKTIDKSPAIDTDTILKGFMMYPTSDATDTYIPFVRLVDTDPGGAGTRDLRHDNSDGFFLASNGRSISFKIPKGFAEKASGPINVSVVRGGETARSPVDITVNANFKIDTMSPTTGSPGHLLTLTGRGFSVLPETTRVFFTQVEGIDPTKGPREIMNLPAMNPTDTQLTVVVPTLDADIAQWMVRVQRGVVGNEIRTNGKLFRTGQGAPEGIWARYAMHDGSCVRVEDIIEQCDVHANGNVRWYLWDAGGGYCVRNNKIFHPASGTLAVDKDKVTFTRCSEDTTLPSITGIGTWDAASGAYKVPADQFTVTPYCMKQISTVPITHICIAKEACKIVLNSESKPVRFHCSRFCFSDPTACPYADGVEADCPP